MTSFNYNAITRLIPGGGKIIFFKRHPAALCTHSTNSAISLLAQTALYSKYRHIKITIRTEAKIHILEN